MVKLTPAEIASMLHRKEERRKEFAAEVDRRIKELKMNKKGHKKAKKAVKHLMNHLLHPTINLKDLKTGTSKNKNGLHPPTFGSSPMKAASAAASETSPMVFRHPPPARPPNAENSNGFLLPPRRTIGHPSAISESAFPTVIGRRNHYARAESYSGSASAAAAGAGANPNYKRFHDYASFSSFSDSSSCIVRRPSVDTISTYLSNSYR